MKRVTITHSRTGQQAECYAKTVKGLSQSAIDTLVFDAHNPHPVSAAVSRALGLVPVDA